METRRKILLRSSSLFGLDNEDMYINLQLSNTVKEFRPDSYENDFDLQQQYAVTVFSDKFTHRNKFKSVAFTIDIFNNIK